MERAVGDPALEEDWAVVLRGMATMVPYHRPEADDARGVLGEALALAGVSLVGTLVLASVQAGLATQLGMVLLVCLARDPKVMGSATISTRLAVAGWGVVFVVTAVAVLLLMVQTTSVA